jgi:hypothetical protein
MVSSISGGGMRASSLNQSAGAETAKRIISLSDLFTMANLTIEVRLILSCAAEADNGRQVLNGSLLGP